MRDRAGRGGGVLVGDARRRAVDGAGCSGCLRELDDGQQAGPGNVRGDGLEGLVHALGRRVERGLLPERRPGQRPLARVRGHRRHDVRRPREPGHDARRPARRRPLADLRAGQHGQVRPLSPHEDVRHRPRPQHDAACGSRSSRWSPATTSCSRSSIRRWRTPRCTTPRRATATRCSARTDRWRARWSPRRASRARRTASSAPATAGPTWRPTRRSTSTTTRRPTATCSRPASSRSAARRRSRSRSGSAPHPPLPSRRRARAWPTDTPAARRPTRTSGTATWTRSRRHRRR